MAESCPVCPIRERENEWLRKQVEQLQTTIVTLSDHYALARLSASGGQPRKPAPEKPKGPEIDIPGPEELERIREAMARDAAMLAEVEEPEPPPPARARRTRKPVPPTSRGEIEASFEKRE